MASDAPSAGVKPRRPSMQWVHGRVAAMRRKFSEAAAAAAHELDSFRVRPLQNQPQVPSRALPAVPSAIPTAPKTHEPVPQIEKSPRSENLPSTEVKPEEGTRQPLVPAKITTKIITIPSDHVAPGLGADLLQFCLNYRHCSANKFTKIYEPFDALVARFAPMYLKNQANNPQAGPLQIYRNVDALPKGIFIFPLNEVTGECLIDFGQVTGFSIGRGCRIAKQPNPLLSRLHCLIYTEGDAVLVKDCDSQSGTFLNGKLLGSSVPTVLTNFDVVQLGYPVKEGSKALGTETAVQFLVVFLDSLIGGMLPIAPESAKQVNVASPASTMKVCKTMSMATLPLSPSCAFEEDDPDNVPDYSFVQSDHPRSAYEPEPVSPSLAVNSPLSPKLSEITTTIPSKTINLQPNASPTRNPQPDHLLNSPFAKSSPQSPVSTPDMEKESSGMLLSEILDAVKNVPSPKIPAPILPVDLPHPSPIQGKRNLSKSMNELLQEDPTLAEITSPEHEDFALIRKQDPDHGKDARLREIIEMLPPGVVIPCISPLYSLIYGGNLFSPAVLTFQLKASARRFERIQKKLESKPTSRDGSILSLDFGLITSDISDGAAIIQSATGNPVQLKCTFNNYRGSWQCESIREYIRILIEPSVAHHVYGLAVSWSDHPEDRVPLATIKFDKKPKFFGSSIEFTINDDDFERISGYGDSKVPLSLIHRLACYRDKMSPPSISIQGVPTKDHEVSITNERGCSMGKFKVARRHAGWTHHSLQAELDLNKDTPANSIYNAVVETAVLLYCLVYHY